MSTQTKPSVVECQGPDCASVGRAWQFHHGKFCSNKCEARRVGRRALAALKSDHTRCFTCFAALKEIDAPKPDYAFDRTGAALTYNADKDLIETVWYSQEETRQSACGYQHRLPDSDIGEKDLAHKTVVGVVCGRCGSVDHRQHIAMIADGHRTAAFVAAYLRAESDDAFDAETLHRTYLDTGDIELATGAALAAHED